MTARALVIAAALFLAAPASYAGGTVTLTDWTMRGDTRPAPTGRPLVEVRLATAAELIRVPVAAPGSLEDRRLIFLLDAIRREATKPGIPIFDLGERVSEAIALGETQGLDTTTMNALRYLDAMRRLKKTRRTEADVREAIRALESITSPPAEAERDKAILQFAAGDLAEAREALASFARRDSDLELFFIAFEAAIRTNDNNSAKELVAEAEGLSKMVTNRSEKVALKLRIAEARRRLQAAR